MATAKLLFPSTQTTRTAALILAPNRCKMFFGALAILCAAFISSTASAAVEIVYDNAKNQPLAVEILKLALAHDPKNETYTYRSMERDIDEKRLVQLVKKGDLSVIWVAFQEKYEDELIPVHIPVYKGLLGHRIFLIRKGDQPKFDAVENLEDLQKLTAGQGTYWADTAILEHSGLEVVTSVKYPHLFQMLDGGRFDYFPRALHEPWKELETFNSLNLEVEDNLLLVYPMPMYFFVAKDNQALADAITEGFRAAIKNGSYDELFFNHPIIKTALEKAKLGDRRVIRIPNPNGTKGLPLDQSELWLSTEELKQ